MQKEVLFFTQNPPQDREAIHLWLGKTNLSHEECLCELIGRYLGSFSIKLAISPTGKLYLPHSPLHFNLSDADDWVAVAFSWQAPVGIDIEVIRPIDEMEELMRGCFSPKEQAYAQKKDQVTRFWAIWNRKEACSKALGVGLQDDMNLWDCHGRGWVFVRGVWVRSVPVQEGLSAAVAIVNKA